MKFGHRIKDIVIDIVKVKYVKLVLAIENMRAKQGCQVRIFSGKSVLYFYRLS